MTPYRAPLTHPPKLAPPAPWWRLVRAWVGGTFRALRRREARRLYAAALWNDGTPLRVVGEAWAKEAGLAEYTTAMADAERHGLVVRATAHLLCDLHRLDGSTEIVRRPFEVHRRRLAA